MIAPTPPIDEPAEIRALQQALLRELRNGHSIPLGSYDGHPVLYHDGRTFVVTGRTGHGAEVYEVIRTDSDALAFLERGHVEPMRDASMVAWSGVKACAVDPWRALFGRVVPGRPASPWDAGLRRATPMQRVALIFSAVLGIFAVIGAGAYAHERRADRVASSGEAAFVAAWREAVARPGADSIADLTAYPFLFEGRRLDRAAFVARAAPALFGPAARRCLQQAQPLREDGRLVLSCAPHGYVFAPTPAGWRLVEFFADTP